MTHHTTASMIGFDRRSGMTRKPRPSEPFIEYQAVERWLIRRFERIDRYFAAVAMGEPAGELLAAVLVEERGISVGSTTNK